MAPVLPDPTASRYHLASAQGPDSISAASMRWISVYDLGAMHCSKGSNFSVGKKK
jgi:hypothetical protein